MIKISKTIRGIIIPIIITAFIKIEGSSQSNNVQYIPVTINSPLFTNKDNELQIGASINNYGFNNKIAGQLKNKILIFSLQYNSGEIEFDPLNFNEYYEQGEENHLIQSKPSQMFYSEIGFGYNFQHKTQNINFIAGIGQQFQKLNSRFFLQFDWGNESKIINAGVSFRSNYTIVQGNNLLTIEPVIQGKLKLWNFRIINQFGYSIPIIQNEDYMKPILTIGIEYIIRNTDLNKVISKLRLAK